MPTTGECSGCRKAPTPRLRFNVFVEDRNARKQLTQLLCEECTNNLVMRLIGRSVERTPQRELDELRFVVTDAQQPLKEDWSGAVA